jgi:hypothetical protein
MVTLYGNAMRSDEMKTQTICVGSRTTLDTGEVQDLTRPVEFIGEKLASRTKYSYSSLMDSPTNARGVTETLYKTEDGRLVVHVKKWSRSPGEPTEHGLCKVTEEDLGVNGRFEALGRKAGYGRPLTLDEALEPLTADFGCFRNSNGTTSRQSGGAPEISGGEALWSR